MDARYWRVICTLVAASAVFGAFAAAITAYPGLPPHIPTHISSDGSATGSAPRWTIFLTPAITLGVFALLFGIRKACARLSYFTEAYEAVLWLVVSAAFGIAIFAEYAVVQAAMHPGAAISQWPAVALTAFMMLCIAILVSLQYRPRRDER